MISFAVPASGACRRTRASHDSLMSNMAAYSRPFGRTPMLVYASSGTRLAVLPRPPMPSASARRLAGSTVSTRTRPPSRAAAVAASAADVVVLPTPPGPQATTTSFAESICSSLRASSASPASARSAALAAAAALARPPRRGAAPSAPAATRRGGLT